jgi:hypothetical protein
MERIRYIIFIALFTNLTACYVVSEDDLFEVYEPKIVVEAQINNIDKSCFVSIAKTANPDDSISYYPVSDAQVIISDNQGNSELLDLLTPGIYIGNEINATPNSEYSLLVSIDELEYAALDVMQMPATVDKAEIRFIDKFVAEAGYYIKLYIQKEKNKTSYYKLEVAKNDSLFNGYNDLIIFEDTYAIENFEYLIPYAFQGNDTVTIDLHKISSEMYKYFYELNKQTNNTFRYIQAPMQNPPSNLSNNALGYFQVSAITRLNILIE